jgi:hypothetical protein
MFYVLYQLTARLHRRQLIALCIELLTAELTCRFVENVNEKALRIAGSQCGLLAGDWSMATKWLNVPERNNFGEDGICNAF